MTERAGGVDILRAAWTNDAFRREIMTGTHAQVVVMTIPSGGEIGEEVHRDTDQLLLFVEGRGKAVLDGQPSELAPNDLVFVRAGTRHNFVNVGDGPLRLITVYAPPEHAPGTVQPEPNRCRGARDLRLTCNRSCDPPAPFGWADRHVTMRYAKVCPHRVHRWAMRPLNIRWVALASPAAGPDR